MRGPPLTSLSVSSGTANIDLDTPAALLPLTLRWATSASLAVWKPKLAGIYPTAGGTRALGGCGAATARFGARRQGKVPQFDDACGTPSRLAWSGEF